MSALTLSRPMPVWTPSTRALGRVEARRLLRHPAYPIGMLYMLAFVVATIVADGIEQFANWLYAVVALAFMLIYAPVTIIAANRVAAATYRRRSRSVLASVPVDERQRTLAMIVGLLRGPVLVGLAGGIFLALLQPFTTTKVADPSNVVNLQNPLAYLEIPAIVLGAGLLGIAVARWLPWPGLMPVVVLAVWLGTGALYKPAGPDGVVPDRAWFMLWPIWSAAETGTVHAQPFGQEMAHLAYLVGLGALAGVAALLRSNRRSGGLWIAAAVAGTVTVLGAWLQLGG